MAEQYDNTNRFVLFKNNKQKETQPDYTGKRVDAISSQRVKVFWKEEDNHDAVTLISLDK